MGISDNIIKKLGTPFQSAKDFSLGLGLPISFAIAKRRNASIKAFTSTSGTNVLVKFFAN